MNVISKCSKASTGTGGDNGGEGEGDGEGGGLVGEGDGKLGVGGNEGGNGALGGDDGGGAGGARGGVGLSHEYQCCRTPGSRAFTSDAWAVLESMTEPATFRLPLYV